MKRRRREAQPSDVRATPRDILGVFWHAMRKYRLLMVGMIIGRIANIITEISIPIFLRSFFNVLASAGGVSEVAVRELTQIILIILAVHCMGWVFLRFTTIANDYFQPWVMSDLTQDAYDTLQRHSYGFFTNRFVGALVRKVTRLPNSFETIADRLYWDLLPVAGNLIGTTVVLYYFNATIASIFLAWAIVFVSIQYVFARWKLSYDVERAKKDTETTAVLADAVTNHNNINLMNGHGYELGRVQKVSEELRRWRTFTWNLNAVMEAVQSGLFILIDVGILYVAVGLWRKGLLTVGDFVLIQSYLMILVNSLWGVGRYFRNIYEALADAKEMVEIMKTPHEIQDKPHATALRVTDGKIEFENVSFQYHNSRQVLDDFFLAIRPHEKVALVGPSGAGKSTIVALLFRLFDPQKGEILIDGQAIAGVTQESLHAAASLVPQEPVLFHRTLLENIRYGRRGATDEEVIAASRLAHCHEFIEQFPEKYGTYVGERGIKLSGGERQRVAIARAILRAAPILVLDEATSSLDSQSEALIQDALKNLMKDKTVIVIAHRLSTIRQMDRIVVLQRGAVVEEGAHDELLAKKGLYERLWKIQSGGFLA